MKEEISPKWSREISRFLTVRPQFLLHGNVYDIFPMEKNGFLTTLRLSDYLKELMLSEGYELIVEYEPVYGFTVLAGTQEKMMEVTGSVVMKDKNLQSKLEKAKQGLKTAAQMGMVPGVRLPYMMFTRDKPYQCGLGRSFEVMEKLITCEKFYCCVMLRYLSRLSDIAPSAEINEFYYRMFRLTQNASPRLIGEAKFPRFNTSFLILDKINDIPPWYTIQNPKIKELPLAKPDYAVRKTIVSAVSRNVPGYEGLDPAFRGEKIAAFIDLTGDLLSGEIVSIVNLARKEDIKFSEIDEAVKRYKLGVEENPWSKISHEKILNAEQHLSKRVVGQQEGVRKASDIIKRAAFNLSGSQYSKLSSRPKGVLFLAGPTGVGKTELAKALTELIFGSETGYIRFDMSEFSGEHTDQRLIGAPPGYVGYDCGGELTNAVRQNPFSVILFDEIEKAHPKILDIFLQLLDDGRLTSGRGETVYFSECLIIFTSNLGVYETTPSGEKIQRVSSEMDYPQIDAGIRAAIGDYFKYRIGRPEILNRIGENVVVFDFIRREMAQKIFTRMTGNVLSRLCENFKISISIDPEVEKKLLSACCEDLSMGGRGIGNHIENVLVNPLSRALFGSSAGPGSDLVMSSLQKTGKSWEITLKQRS
ncbi:MAG: AAA family ATPase [Candidatus Wallbacteria bacterium]|nr:AAA family ATPase [Candidatus Wallbacteria bacterium]